MENPRFSRAAARRRATALALAILFHILLLAGIAWMSAGGADSFFGGDNSTVEVTEPAPLP